MFSTHHCGKTSMGPCRRVRGLIALDLAQPLKALEKNK